MRAIAHLVVASAALAVSVIVPAAGQAPPAALFPASDQCMACHNGLKTPSGEDVSIGLHWRPSMMANAGRDPYWQASVRREVLDHPAAQADVEDECTICHMPMATYTARAAGGRGVMFANAPALGATTPVALLAADGVSCAACHQIERDGLGTRESFTGGYRVSATPAPGGMRHAYGPFLVDAGRQRIMSSATGFQQTETSHIRQSELCATCHTLFTHSITADGSAGAELPEQVPYLEWLQSDYRDSLSCQACHMPVISEPTPIASVLGQPREGAARHDFRGGNFFMPRLLDAHRAELAVAATPAELQAASDRAVAHLQGGGIGVRVEEVRREAGRLDATVTVENHAGHKMPTAYPSRRAWLHVVVRDARGTVVFESGRLGQDGAIAGNDGDHDAARYEPHYATITSPDEVQVYESVMVDAAGRVTTGLLTGVRYVKDNRLLPAGFDKGRAPADVAVHGAAASDADFLGGSDRVKYEVNVGDRPGPFSVDAELVYQPIGFRWAQNLRTYDAAEPGRFVRYYDDAASTSAVVVAKASGAAR